MKKRLLLVLLTAFVILGVIMILLVLSNEKALLTHPKGIIAKSEIKLVGIAYLLMFSIVIPTFIFLFWVIGKYRVTHKAKKKQNEHSYKAWHEALLWVIPAVIVTPLAFITWKAAHELDPYEPLKSEITPLTIQVVAMDWKWLFIYPEQGIATVNFFQIPEQTPIQLQLCADGSPMNSFWLPELSGQIYAMTGMTTKLHLMADGPGIYTGRAAEINGEGFSDMTFVAESAHLPDFEQWVQSVKQSPLRLTAEAYDTLMQPSIKHPVALYSYVENDLFNTIVDKYMHP